MEGGMAGNLVARSPSMSLREPIAAHAKDSLDCLKYSAPGWHGRRNVRFHRAFTGLLLVRAGRLPLESRGEHKTPTMTFSV